MESSLRNVAHRPRGIRIALLRAPNARERHRPGIVERQHPYHRHQKAHRPASISPYGVIETLAMTHQRNIKHLEEGGMKRSGT